MKGVAVLLLAAWCSVGAHAAPPQAQPVTGEALLKGTLAKPAARLATAQVLSGRFTHGKQLRDIPRPLTATGEFVFARELGVYWHTREPFDSVVVLTPSGIAEKVDGTQTMQLSADDQPAVRMIAKVFLALFTLDMASLERNFSLTSMTDGSRWTIGLAPRGKSIASVFAQATISGGADVEQVILTDAHGDRTVIDLTDLQYSDSRPDAKTRALFGPARP